MRGASVLGYIFLRVRGSGRWKKRLETDRKRKGDKGGKVRQSNGKRKRF